MTAMATWTGRQQNYRFRTVNAVAAALNAAFDGADPAQNANPSVPVDTIFRFRVSIEETAGGAANKTFSVRYQLNGSGGYQVLNGTTPIQLVAVTGYDDDDPTDNLLTGGTGGFLAGYGGNNTNTLPSAGNQAWTGNQESEYEIALLIDSAQVIDGEFFDLRIYESNGTALTTYTVTARVTAVEAEREEVSLTGVLPGLEGAFGVELNFYALFRRTPQTGAVFDPDVDTPIAFYSDTTYIDEDVPEGDYDYQVFAWTGAWSSGSEVVQVSVVAVVEVDFDGTLPGLTGSFTAIPSSSIALVGNLPGLEGSFVLTSRVAASLTGALPELEGAFSFVNVNTLTLVGALPGLQGGFDLDSSAAVTLAGVLPGLEGEFSTDASTDIAFAGVLPGLTGVFQIIEQTDTVLVTFAGVLPGLEGSFGFQAGVVDLALAGVLPELEASFVVSPSATAALAGQLPGLSGSFSLAMGTPTVVFAGTLPGLEASFVSTAAVGFTLVGPLPGLEGSFAVAVETITVTVTGVLPGLDGIFSLDVATNAVAFAGVLPGLNGAFAVSSSATVAFVGVLPGLDGRIVLVVGELVDIVVVIGCPDTGWKTGGTSVGWSAGSLAKT